jgi:hypothetical protein
LDDNRGDPNKTWVKAIAKKLRDDLGDCPTLPDDMLRLIDKLREERAPNTPDALQIRRPGRGRMRGGD